MTCPIETRLGLSELTWSLNKPYQHKSTSSNFSQVFSFVVQVVIFVLEVVYIDFVDLLFVLVDMDLDLFRFGCLRLPD